MKTTIATAVTLATCVSTQVFAQTKQDIITMALTGLHQNSVSTTTGNDVGDWSQEPRYYKSTTDKVTDQSVIKFIGYVLHGNANYYSAKAHLVLVQGELSGFFGITPDLGLSTANYSFNGDEDYLNGSFDSDDGDSSTAINNSTDSAFVTLDNGHHFLLNTISGQYPVGHLQPWGQIFIQDPGLSDFSATDPDCENVTYFFAMTVEECYDCFYMNSFVSDATFTIKSAAQSGPPCCGVGSTLLGSGKDRYYLTLSFDNTENNPYLFPGSSCYANVLGIGPDSHPAGPIAGDGVVPDQINVNPYNDPIASLVGKNLPYEARFTLDGILTYTWSLKFINNTDIFPDFVGVGNYSASGYGFVGLFCQLFTGTATFSETIVKTACCTDENWYDDGGWYGVGAEYIGVEEGYETLYEYDFEGDFAPYYTPMNVSTSLTFHQNFDKVNYPWNYDQFNGIDTPSGWESSYPNNGVVYPLVYQ